MRRAVRAGSLVWLGLALLVAACSRPPPGPAAEGMIFPPLTVRGDEGQPVPWPLPPARLRVVNVWAVWCPPCRREMPDLQYLADTLREEGIVVTTLAVEEDPHLVTEFLRRYRLRLPVALIDPHRAEARLGAYEYPLTLLVDAQGVIRLRLHGALDWRHPGMLALLRDLAADRRVSAERRKRIIAEARSRFLRQGVKARGDA